jgi:hypothetical protein
MFFGESQSFLNGARGSGIELMGNAFAHHALGRWIDFDSNGTGGNDFTADNDVQCFLLPLM